jgi:RNA ligase (TIGR02306 family)
MSDFRVEVLELPPAVKHENADALSIVEVFGSPVVIRTESYTPGQKVAYVPVDSVVPLESPLFDFLKDPNKPSRTHARIKAKKLRGVYSEGMLVPADPTWEIGQDVAGTLGIAKYEEPEQIGTGGQAERDPGFMPIYDVESYRKWSKRALVDGEFVVVTEKLHGSNGRFCFKEGRLWVASHKQVKAEDPTNLWWKVAAQENLAEKLAKIPGIVLYAEVYGSVQDLKYDAKPGQIMLAAFDLYDSDQRRFLDWNEFQRITSELQILTVPVLYAGAYIPHEIEPLRNGQSTIANNMREGIVIKPAFEREHDRLGRVCLKLVGEDYMLRKGGTEHH